MLRLINAVGRAQPFDRAGATKCHIAPFGAHSRNLLTTSIRVEVIMAKVSNPVLSILLAITLLSGIKLSLQSARADNCFAAPNASAPKRQALVTYRTERQRGRESRHLHAAARTRSNAAISAASTVSTHTKPASPDVAVPPPPQR
jgi:hypothetical protein